jgi:hypothetical protein
MSFDGSPFFLFFFMLQLLLRMPHPSKTKSAKTYEVALLNTRDGEISRVSFEEELVGAKRLRIVERSRGESEQGQKTTPVCRYKLACYTE